MITNARFIDEENTLIAATIDGTDWSGLRLSTDTELNARLTAWVQEGGVIAPYEPPASVPPQVVSPYQARMALLNAGHLATVEALMADPSTDQAAKIAWEYATVFERHSPFIATLAPALGLSDAAVDALFVAAAAI